MLAIHSVTMAHNNFDVVADGGVDIRTEYDDKNAAITELIQALAVIEDTPMTELDPLYESIEIEAVAELLSHADKHDCTVGVEFAYSDFTVTIDGSGTIHIHDGSPKIARSEEGKI